MSTTHKRSTLLAAGIAAALGLGLAGCNPSSPPDSPTASPTSNSGDDSTGLSGAVADTQEAMSDARITTRVKAEGSR